MCVEDTVSQCPAGVGFEVLTAVNKKLAVFWDTRSMQADTSSLRFLYCLHRDDGGSTDL
jgi:hypothetical protein